MMKNMKLYSRSLLTTTSLVLIIFSLILSSTIQAEEKPKAGTEKESTPVPAARQFVTQHTGRFNGQLLQYTATAGETYLRDKEGQSKASIFTFSYIRSDAKEGENRPVTFVWNGGPGSASLWLHMGTYGPKRISVPSDASHPGSPPFDVIDAPETILDVTDLVFVDPVGTGFSRALGKHENKEFWGLKEDATSLAEFIRTWVTEHGRWNSPRFLLGESYGTTRAALIANLLQGEKFQMGLNGIIFVSQALDYAGSTPYRRDNIIAHITYLPTMAATALYHGKVNPRPENKEKFLNEARSFATDELLPALFKGNRLDQDSRQRIRDRLAWFTGLSPEYIDKANLRIQGHRFAKELMREEGLTIGFLDSRYTSDEIDDLNAEPATDPASTAIAPAFKSALMDYMHRDLKVDWDRVYLAPADKDLGEQWRYRTAPDGKYWEPWPVNTAHELSSALRLNPQLKVLVASGHYDLVTPFFDAEFTLSRHDIKAEQIVYKYYGGGHMMYINEPSRTRLLDDTRSFILQQLGY
jgi:carboxypeptidase C (cathepsin A)